MTSQLRRKRPITPPNTPRRRARAAKFPLRLGPAAALIAALAVVVGEAPAAEPLDALKWLAPPAPDKVAKSEEVPQTTYYGPMRSVVKHDAPPERTKSRWTSGSSASAAGSPATSATGSSDAGSTTLQWRSPQHRSSRAGEGVARTVSHDVRTVAQRDGLSRPDPFEENLSRPPLFDQQPAPAQPLEEQPSAPEAGPAPTPMPGLAPSPPDFGPLNSQGAFGREFDAGMRRDECKLSWEKLQAKTLPTISLDIGVGGMEGRDFPIECALPGDKFAGRAWDGTTFFWKASALCHKPLYFEEVALERYGHTLHPVLQPFVSGAHFFTNIAILPYRMGLKTPNECVYALGYYRPGSCAPKMISPPGFTPRAALFEAGAWVAGAAIIP
jgi:hypothetical protein